MKEKYFPIFFGVVLSLLTLVYAEFLASTFGLYEKDIKAALLQEAREHTEGVVVPGHEHEEDISRKVFKNEKEAKKTAKKAWVYLKRAHAHAEGMGAIALALVLLIGHTALKPLFKKILSIMVGAGGFAYPLCWFYAGVWMVDKGKEAAKADIHYLALSSVSLYLGGLMIIFALLLLHYFKPLKAINYFFEDL